jgi:hypothetical protein
MEEIEGLANLRKDVGLTYHERMFSFASVPFYCFPKIVTAKAVVVLGTHWECVNGQSGYDPGLQSEGMRLGGDVYQQFIHLSVTTACETFETRKILAVWLTWITPPPTFVEL